LCAGVSGTLFSVKRWALQHGVGFVEGRGVIASASEAIDLPTTQLLILSLSKEEFQLRINWMSSFDGLRMRMVG
jgi:hypothetical protein